MKTANLIPSLFPETSALAPAPAARARRRRRLDVGTLPVVDRTPRASFRPLPVASILNENANRELPFYWTINPYRGCEFGCSFCYARYTHEYFDHHDPESFSSKIYVKFQAAQVLAESVRPGTLRGRPVAIGTASDPYQPAEKRFEVTRRLLQVLARCPDLELSITTRSPLIVRDLDLLQQISKRGKLTVHVSLITLNPRVARIVERRAPSPRRRLDTIRALSQAGIETSVFVMPILPGITDSGAETRALLRAAREAGAGAAVGQIVRLWGGSWTSFAAVLDRHFPHLRPMYESLRRGDPGGRSLETLERFRALRDELGLRAPDRRGVSGKSDRSGEGWLFNPVELDRFLCLTTIPGSP
jgi:DNA repair photolyase